jgi:hypothetical protein
MRTSTGTRRAAKAALLEPDDEGSILQNREHDSVERPAIPSKLHVVRANALAWGEARSSKRGTQHPLTRSGKKDRAVKEKVDGLENLSKIRLPKAAGTKVHCLGP